MDIHAYRPLYPDHKFMKAGPSLHKNKRIQDACTFVCISVCMCVVCVHVCDVCVVCMCIVCMWYVHGCVVCLYMFVCMYVCVRMHAVCVCVLRAQKKVNTQLKK